MRNRCLMQNLLLLDSDVIIDLHELGYWEGVVKNNLVHVASTVARCEVNYYKKEGKKISIDLVAQIDKGKIKEESVTAEEQADVEKRLKIVSLDGLDAGELESITIVAKDKLPDLKICLVEITGTKAAAFLGLGSKMLSVEEVLINSGILKRGKPIKYRHSDKKLRDLITEGKFLAIDVS